MENLNKIKNKIEEMKAKYSLEQEQEDNPNHSNGFGMYWSGFFACLKEISFFLDSQEQPKVDLKEEIASFFSKNPIPHEHITDWPLLKNTALHFFNLGLNARKEENK